MYDTNYSYIVFIANKHTDKKVKYFTYSCFEWYVFECRAFRMSVVGDLLDRNTEFELEWLNYRGLKCIHNVKELAFNLSFMNPNIVHIVDSSALIVPIVNFAVKNPYISI